MTEFSLHESLAALEVVVVGHWEVRRKGGDSFDGEICACAHCGEDGLVGVVTRLHGIICD